MIAAEAEALRERVAIAGPCAATYGRVRRCQRTRRRFVAFRLMDRFRIHP